MTKKPSRSTTNRPIRITTSIRSQLESFLAVLRRNEDFIDHTDEEVICEALQLATEELVAILGTESQDRSQDSLPYERWRDIPGYKGHYQASNKGRIKSLKRTKNGMHLIIAQQDFNGYSQVTLRHKSLRNGQRAERTHRLVALTFIGKAPSKNAHVDHRNGNRMDCSARNLRWVTPSENNRARTRRNSISGELNPSSRFSNDEVKTIRKQYKEGMSQTEIARIHGVSAPTIRGIILRNTYRTVK